MKNSFNNNRGFGVEIEFLTPSGVTKQDVATKITNLTGETCIVESYNHHTREHWKIVHDASVYTTSSDRGYSGHNEIVSPILYGESGLKKLERIVQCLNLLECKVNFHCGLHIHHDITDTLAISDKHSTNFIKNLIKWVAKYEDVIYKLVSPSRLDNRRYSIPVRESYLAKDLSRFTKTLQQKNKSIDTEVKAEVGRKQSNYRLQNTRASGLNLKNIWTRGAVEFRYHQGSLNFEKISNWIVVTQAIINTVETKRSVNLYFNTAPQTKAQRLGKFKRAVRLFGNNECELSKKAGKYISKRFKHFSNQESRYLNKSSYGYVRNVIVQNYS